jgi:hypothetical protein
VPPLLPRSNMHGRKRSFTEKYDSLHNAVLRSYISVTVYGDLRRKKRSFIVFVYGFRIRPPSCSVFIRILSRGYTTVILDHVIRSHTESVTVHLGKLIN